MPVNFRQLATKVVDIYIAFRSVITECSVFALEKVPKMRHKMEPSSSSRQLSTSLGRLKEFSCRWPFSSQVSCSVYGSLLTSRTHCNKAEASSGETVSMIAGDESADAVLTARCAGRCDRADGDSLSAGPSRRSRHPWRIGGWKGWDPPSLRSLCAARREGWRFTLRHPTSFHWSKATRLTQGGAGGMPRS